MILLILSTSMILFTQNISDKIQYQHHQEYLTNIVYNLCAIDVDDSTTDKLFVEQFLQQIKNKKIGSIFDAWVKPDLDRQRIYQFILSEFSVFIAKESYELAYSSGVNHDQAMNVKNQVLDLLNNLLSNHQYFDLYNHYGLLRGFKGFQLIDMVKQLLAK